MDAIQDETVVPSSHSASHSDSPSRYDRFVERFLQDDGSICLGFILLIYFIYRGIQRMITRMSTRSQSSDSSGLSSTSTTNSYTSSGLSSMGSEGATNSKSTPGVPLSRMLLWLLFVSVVGFLWGTQFSDDAEMNAIIGAIASLIGLEVNDAAVEPNVSTSEMKPDVDPKTSALLERYVKEQQEKNLSLPTFASETETVTSNAMYSYRRKRFAEFLVHPILLASKKPVDTVAIAVNTDFGKSIDPKMDGTKLAKALMKEILLYKDVDEITVFLVSSEAASKEGCPPELSLDQLVASDEKNNVKLECLHIDPSWGHENEDYIDDNIIKDDDYDVSIVLSGCNSRNIEDRIWEEDVFENTNTIVSTCSGPMRPPGVSLTGIGVKEQYHRFAVLEEFFAFGMEEMDAEDLGNSTQNATSTDHYAHVFDYDILGLNMAVAFNKDIYRWHLNEAEYNTNLVVRLKPNSFDSLLFFEAPDMTTLEYASKQSADSYCAYLEDHLDPDDDEFLDEKLYCEQGFNPNFQNIPIDKIYVAKSGSGENAGRGVFTSVDILEHDTYVGMETNVQSVFYPPSCKAIVEEVMDMTIYKSFDEEIKDEDDDDDDDDDEDDPMFQLGESDLMTNRLHRAPSTYAEAYGFDDEPWGVPQTSVMSNILTFTNHGCNGTANIGVNVPGLNEFTMDVHSPGFEIPEEFLQFSPGYYLPHRDRVYMGLTCTVRVKHPPVLAGEELFDNYIEFGGMKHFEHMVGELKRDCSGAMGTVEKQQHLLKKISKISKLGNPVDHPHDTKDTETSVEKDDSEEISEDVSEDEEIEDEIEDEEFEEEIEDEAEMVDVSDEL